MLYARKVAASHDMGTRIVVEAQTEIGAFSSQNSGGPLRVTEMLAAVDFQRKDTVQASGQLIPICRSVKIPAQAHSNPIIEVEKNEMLMSIRAL
jgi:hypothetical protein